VKRHGSYFLKGACLPVKIGYWVRAARRKGVRVADTVRNLDTHFTADFGSGESADAPEAGEEVEVME
jgi:hypothetical protein